jgi:hypothetical protein
VGAEDCVVFAGMAWLLDLEPSYGTALPELRQPLAGP